VKADKQSKRVLVVDDEPVLGTTFERVIAPEGYAVVPAGCGALDKLPREEFDVQAAAGRLPVVVVPRKRCRWS
jgi:CheY-like chemotaxis protein